jgi:predicted transposase YdaD
MNDELGVNREYRDRLFKFIFGNPENKEWTLSLYNAVNGTNYTDTSTVRLNTIENAVYMSMKNDISFLFDNTLNFYEQQSTYNPNMPMRFLIYSGMIYARYVEENRNYHRYSSSLQKAPAPQCVCFYNGSEDKEDRTVLKLTDSFDARSDIQVTVTMININYGHNKELLEACKPLKDYAFFVDMIRSDRDGEKSLKDAVEAAFRNLPDDSCIKPFLLANKAEVTRMCITEYDEARTFADQREEGHAKGLAEGLAEGRAEGRAEGLAEGMIGTLTNLVRRGLLTIKQAADEAGLSVSEFEEKTGLKA